MLVCPSPKSHDHDVISPVDRLEKDIVHDPLQTVRLPTKSAWGCGIDVGVAVGTGMGDGVNSGVGIGVGVGDRVGVGVGEAIGDQIGVDVAAGVGIIVGVGDRVGVGVGVSVVEGVAARLGQAEYASSPTSSSPSTRNIAQPLLICFILHRNARLVKRYAKTGHIYFRC